MAMIDIGYLLHQVEKTIRDYSMEHNDSNFYKHCFWNYGVSEKAIKLVTDFAIEKINKFIDAL